MGLDPCLLLSEESPLLILIVVCTAAFVYIHYSNASVCLKNKAIIVTGIHFVDMTL